MTRYAGSPFTAQTAAHTGRKLGYARVSTLDQRLHMQCDALDAAGCAPVYTDHGISGSKGRRPGLDALLEDVRPGDMVMVFKLDRLGRSVLHLADLLVRFQRAEVHFCSLTEGINTTTPGGKLVYHVFSAVAEFHRDIIVENTVEGLAAARRRGKTLGRPRALNAVQTVTAFQLILDHNMAKTEVARTFGVSTATLARAFERLDLYEGASAQAGGIGRGVQA